MKLKPTFILLLLLFVLFAGFQTHQAWANSSASTGSATLLSGTLTPGNSVTIRFEVTPIATSPTQNDYADGFYAMLPSGWELLSISDAPSQTSQAQCGGSHTITQDFCNAPNTIDEWAFAYWGHAEGAIDACGYQIPAGSECGVYLAPDVAVGVLQFDVTVAIPKNAPTCADGSVEISADTTQSNSLFGVLVSDGFAGPGSTWAGKNTILPFSNDCGVPAAVALAKLGSQPLRRGLVFVFFGLAVVTSGTLWHRRRVGGGWMAVGLLIVLVFVLTQQIWATPPSQGYNSTGHQLADAGPFGWDDATVSVARGLSGASGSFDAQLYWPTVAGTFDATKGPYPAVVFAHGFNQTYDRYGSTLEHLATQGYLVLAPRTQGGFFVNHNTYALEVQDSLSYFDAANVDVANLLFGAIDTSGYGLLGHSMGGGAVVQAAGNDTRVKALVPLAAAQLNSGGADAIAAASTISAPTLFIVGEKDSTVGTADNSQLMANNLSTSYQLAEVDEADHCDFQESVFPWRDGLTCGFSFNALPHADGIEYSQHLMTGFLNQYLKGQDRAHWRVNWGPERFADGTLSAVDSQPKSSLAVPVTAQAGSGGQAVVYQVALTNESNSAETFTLSASANRWATTLSTDSVTVPANQTTTLEVTVTLPAGALAKSVREDTVLLSAISADSARSYLELTTTFQP